jgi:membrane-bound lytic murein transglycosylase D|tara:strand:- start:914 stop:1777 length:864 start_codon:yes stop_codon:yes gene_type:complete
VSDFYSLGLIISSTPSIKFYTEILEEEKLPVDLAVIPLLESGNNPLAKSPKDALGLWQFIPSTAKEWGLATNRIDNRTNVIKSTHVAIRYLKYLHNQLGDWNLALAAYNWGIGNVKRALKKGLVSNNSINLKKLPQETRNYLISYHHLNRLIRDNVKNSDLTKFPNVKYLVRIKKSDLSNYISTNKLIDIDKSVLKHINGYDVFKWSDSDKAVLVPSVYFKKYFSTKKISYKKSSSKSGCPKKYYKTKYRDTFEKLAKRYRVKMDSLREMNPQISFLRPGMKIKLCY